MCNMVMDFDILNILYLCQKCRLNTLMIVCQIFLYTLNGLNIVNQCNYRLKLPVIYIHVLYIERFKHYRYLGKMDWFDFRPTDSFLYIKPLEREALRPQNLNAEDELTCLLYTIY